MAAGRVDPISAINPTKTDWIINVRVVRISKNLDLPVEFS
ncbi:uncharacterized protein G2W53_017421 [Senna tora]|uniref:Uncharacterized protein n=1 Tax=Senna tora TaxID=362788 RepID=A0A834TRV2_9FABA|nr:uncharacterized protein G2W53_017421 [Senna tora]